MPDTRPPRSTKPLGGKSYGSIAHLPGSRLGPGDQHCDAGQARIAMREARDRHDVLYVQEKLDGGNVAVAKVDGHILALGRSGYLATTSPFEQHHLFAYWVRLNAARFDALLAEGERAVGEWLAQAHGTRYDLRHEPFVLFDLMVGPARAPVASVLERAASNDFVTPHSVHQGAPLAVADAMALLGTRDAGGHYGYHGALDPVEGAVWRVERHGQADFVVKYVRPDKVDGLYLPEVSGQPAVWNWRPTKAGDARQSRCTTPA